MTTTTYTYYCFKSGTVERGLTLAEAGWARMHNSEGDYRVGLETEREEWSRKKDRYDYDLDADGEGWYRLMHRGAGMSYGDGYRGTIVYVRATSRAEAEDKAGEEVALLDWSNLRGDVVTDAEFDQWIVEAREAGDADQLRCYGLDDEADAIEAAAEASR